MGSGTTALSCVDLKRKYLGIELHQKYVDLANERLEKINNLENFMYGG